MLSGAKTAALLGETVARWRYNLGLMERFDSPELEANSLRDANEMLRQASARFQSLFHHLPIACFTFDKAGRIQELNDEFSRMLGLDIQHVFQQPITEVFESAGAFLRVFDEQESTEFEWAFNRSDGQRLTLVSLATSLRPERGRADAICCIINVSERKTLESQLTEKLRALEASRTELEAKLSLMDTLVHGSDAGGRSPAAHGGLTLRKMKQRSVFFLAAIVLLAIGFTVGWLRPFGGQAEFDYVKTASGYWRVNLKTGVIESAGSEGWKSR